MIELVIAPSSSFKCSVICCIEVKAVQRLTYITLHCPHMIHY